MDNSINLSLPTGCIIGRFLSESKNRFLCTVEVDSTEESCYIASSCRLDNFIDLKGKRVLLLENKGRNNSTRYSVLGVKHKQSYILLNTSWANKAMEMDLRSRRFSCMGHRTEFKKETVIGGYRTDFFIPKTNTIIEVKSVISTSDTASFPTVFSERTLHQLETINTLLSKGYKAFFVIISLNPYVKTMKLLENTECCRMLQDLAKKGLHIKSYTCRLNAVCEPHIQKEIPIYFGR